MRQKPIVEIIEEQTIETSSTPISELSPQQRMEMFQPNSNIDAKHLKTLKKNMSFNDLVKLEEEEYLRKLEYEKAKPQSINNRQNGYNKQDKYTTIEGYGFNISIETDMDF